MAIEEVRSMRGARSPVTETPSMIVPLVEPLLLLALILKRLRMLLFMASVSVLPSFATC